LILQALLACGLGGVFLIPHVAEDQPCRVKMELPKMLGDWVGTPAAVSEKEHAQLAKDTEFERKMYNDGLGDEIYVSIVLSGHELDSSIHRPERCLSAQGWTTEDASGLKVPVAEAPGGWLPVTRLRNWKEFTDSNGAVKREYYVDYYWFIGYSDITASHWEREYIDMRDRVLHGYNQRWAFVTVAATVTEGLEPPGREALAKNTEQTDEMLQNMIALVYPAIMKDAPK
jgi:EpsI family protein